MDQHQGRQKDSPALENISETSKNAKKNNRRKQIFLTEIQIFSNFDLVSVASSLQEQNNNRDAQEVGILWLENIKKAYLKQIRMQTSTTRKHDQKHDIFELF